MKNYKFTINGNKYSVEVGDIENNSVNVEVNGTPYTVELETEVKAPVKVKPVVMVNAGAQKSAPAAAPANVKSAPAAATAAGATLKSPLPGTILDVKVAQGASVKKGDVLAILEAMKMENEILAPQDGSVAQISVGKGASVNSGDVLIVLN